MLRSSVPLRDFIESLLVIRWAAHKDVHELEDKALQIESGNMQTRLETLEEWAKTVDTSINSGRGRSAGIIALIQGAATILSLAIAAALLIRTFA